MLNAKHDRVIPPACTNALWERIGRPEIHWWNADHYSAIWKLPAGLALMCQFFNADHVDNADASRPSRATADVTAPEGSSAGD
jgi:hypothetical protein